MTEGCTITATESGPAKMMTADPRGTLAVAEKVPLREFRCPHCGILVFKGHLESGSVVQIVCPRDTCDKQRRHMGPARYLAFGDM